MALSRKVGAQFDASLYGEPVYLGTIIATTTKNNNDTATPFSNTGDALKGKLLMVQSDAACYVRPLDANDGTVTTSNGVKLAADQLYYMNMPADRGWVAAVAVSGTANVRVFEMR